MSKNLNIVFTDTIGVSDEYFPQPASKYVPDWYKNSPSYITDKKEPNPDMETISTIKRCMPVFDSINSGYIISSPCDIWIKQIPVDEENQEITQPLYQWTNYNLIQFHPIVQAPNYSNNTGHTHMYPKWTNPWSIKTPPGYSTLFVQPFHRPSPFTILPGVVDTDKYFAPVNFPFVLNEPTKFEGLIPAGTPIAQAIPFKRDSWEMSIGNQNNFVEQNKISVKLKTKFFDSYKIHFRQKKEYK